MKDAKKYLKNILLFVVLIALTFYIVLKNQSIEDIKNALSSVDVRFLGEIYISYERCKEQAASFGHSVRREFSYLAVHGLLHLLGYDHMTEEDKKVMRALEEEILNEYDIKR